jgi:hypothetical protein
MQAIAESSTITQQVLLAGLQALERSLRRVNWSSSACIQRARSARARSFTIPRTRKRERVSRLLMIQGGQTPGCSDQVYCG